MASICKPVKLLFANTKLGILVRNLLRRSHGAQIPSRVEIEGPLSKGKICLSGRMNATSKERHLSPCCLDITCKILRGCTPLQLAEE